MMRGDVSFLNLTIMTYTAIAERMLRFVFVFIFIGIMIMVATGDRMRSQGSRAAASENMHMPKR